MIIRRLLVALLGLWVLGLAIASQPRHERPPSVTHAKSVEYPAPDLPTLAPLRP